MPSLGSGEVPNRYAKEEVDVSPEDRQEVDDFVTKKLEEIRKRVK